MFTNPDLLSSAVLSPFPRYIDHLRTLTSSSLPPLPSISSDLSRIAFTHTSFVVRVAQTFKDAQVWDNERFEFYGKYLSFLSSLGFARPDGVSELTSRSRSHSAGDRVVGIALAMLIEEKHDKLTVGSMTVRRSFNSNLHLLAPETVELVRCVSSGPAHKLTWGGEMEVDGKVVAKAEGQATKMDLKHLYVYLSVRFPFHFTLLQDLTTFLRCS